MKCHSCQSEVPDGSKFCRSCGVELSVFEKSCPGCGRSLQADAKFCNSCGAATGAPPLTVVQGCRIVHGKEVGVGFRAVATILDFMILFALSFIVALFSGGTVAAGFELQGGPFFLMTFIGFSYYVFFEWKLGGTPGKLALGLQVVKLNGCPCDLQAALIRTVSRIADGLFCYLVAAVAVWSSERKQRIGDRIAGTLVVKRVTDVKWQRYDDKNFNDSDE